MPPPRKAFPIFAFLLRPLLLTWLRHLSPQSLVIVKKTPVIFFSFCHICHLSGYCLWYDFLLNSALILSLPRTKLFNDFPLLFGQGLPQMWSPSVFSTSAPTISPGKLPDPSQAGKLFKPSSLPLSCLCWWSRTLREWLLFKGISQILLKFMVLLKDLGFLGLRISFHSDVLQFLWFIFSLAS